MPASMPQAGPPRDRRTPRWGAAARAPAGDRRPARGPGGHAREHGGPDARLSSGRHTVRLPCAAMATDPGRTKSPTAAPPTSAPPTAAPPAGARSRSAGARSRSADAAAFVAGALAPALALAGGAPAAGRGAGAPPPAPAIGAPLIELQPPGAKELFVGLFGTDDKL